MCISPLFSFSIRYYNARVYCISYKSINHVCIPFTSLPVGSKMTICICFRMLVVLLDLYMNYYYIWIWMILKWRKMNKETFLSKEFKHLYIRITVTEWGSPNNYINQWNRNNNMIHIFHIHKKQNIRPWTRIYYFTYLFNI